MASAEPPGHLTRRRPEPAVPDINDPGLLSAEEAGLLIDLYELTMAASYLAHDRDEPAVFELFLRHLPPRRNWLLVAGLGPTIALVRGLGFGEAELDYLGTLGFGSAFLDYLARFRFSGDIDAMPEGTVAFASEPLVRVTAPRIEAQILETLLLNQINFQTMLATKAARLVVAACGGRPGQGGRLIDFSPRRDHGAEAAMKAARAAAIAGFDATSNVAAAMRYGLRPAGTMAHSYVMSFASEEAAFRAFMRDQPTRAVMLVDTYDTLEGVRRAVDAARATGVPLAAIRIDSGDLAELSVGAREILDSAGMPGTEIIVSGDLTEARIGELVAGAAPIDAWGVGTELGTSPDSPTVNGVYKLVAHRCDGEWAGVWKRSPGKATAPGVKQVVRRYSDGMMCGDLIALDDEDPPGERLLVPFMRNGEVVRADTLAQMRVRAAGQLAALPPALRSIDPRRPVQPYPVEWSWRCRPPLDSPTSGAREE